MFRSTLTVAFAPSRHLLGLALVNLLLTISQSAPLTLASPHHIRNPAAAVASSPVGFHPTLPASPVVSHQGAHTPFPSTFDVFVAPRSVSPRSVATLQSVSPTTHITSDSPIVVAALPMTSPSPSPTVINSTRVGSPVIFVAPSDISYSSHSSASNFRFSTIGPPAALASILPAVILPPFHQSASDIPSQHGSSKTMASSTFIVYAPPRPTSNAAYQSLTPIIYPGTAAHAMSSIATDLVFASGTIGSSPPSGSPAIMPGNPAKAPSPAIVSSTPSIDSIIATATSRVVEPTPSMATSSLPSGASVSSGLPTGVSSSASTTRPASRSPGWKASLLVLCSIALLVL